MYFENLRVEYDALLAREIDLPESILTEISRIFSEKRSWINAYKIEQYLSHICDEEALDTDLKRYLVDYRNHFQADAVDHYRKELEEIEEKNKGLTEKRSILLRMQAELHSFYVKRSECQEFGFLTRVRVSFVFMTAVATFIATLFYCFYFRHMVQSSEMIIVTFSSGFLGASFSLLIGLNEHIARASLEDLRVMHRLNFILKRTFVGIGAALTTYFLLQSGLLENILAEELLPRLPVEDDGEPSKTYPNISKLIIWAFIAGFSEMFVPRILGSVEKRISPGTP